MLSEKSNLHPRNQHRNGYDFAQLMKACPDLVPYVAVNKFGTTSIDFSDGESVKMLNRALLLYFYKVKYWDIPPGYLCPPIPGRVDYIHYMADVLRDSNGGVMPKAGKIRVLDVGVGANVVYPLIGHSVYGWQFVGSDIDPAAIVSAKKIIDYNALGERVEVRLQTNASHIYQGIIRADEVFDLSICNPPFHSSLAEATAGTARKWKNLGRSDKVSPLNFGGQRAELWCRGGELSFIKNMITESVALPSKCLWYSTLVSKSIHLDAFYKLLNKVNAAEVKTIAMSQGQKVSRVLVWTFLNLDKRAIWAKERW